MGGRSRVAAQLLAGQGFKKVYNLSGGIKAWYGRTAVGPEDLGLELFSGQESAAQSLIIAYSLEQGLRDFYLSMAEQIRNEEARVVFGKLADIEIKHQDSIFGEYRKMTDSQVSRDDFEQTIVVKAVEGGLTTEEFIRLYQPEEESVSEIISIAMAIEAQALDLYLRAVDRTKDPGIKKTLTWIAAEEKSHLKMLGELIDRTTD